MKALAGWASALRIARREARRARGRSVLVLVMITLPVLAVTCADVLVHTYDVSGTEALDRRVGAADALVSFDQNVTRVAQGADPDQAVAAGGSAGRQPDTGLGAVAAALHRPVRGIERHEGSVRVATDKGQADVGATELDLRDRLAQGFFELQQGRLPRTRKEVVVNASLAERGPGIGSDLRIVDGPTRRVVGIVRSTTSKEPGRVVGLPGSLPIQSDPHEVEWLVDAHGPVRWSDVRALNRIGAVVVSPYVLRHPPSQDQLPPSVRGSDGGTDSALLTVVVLIVVMALIEVVLLAGPAFAVGARRLQHSLALVACAGGTPRQMRRVVLATAVVLGGLAAAVGLAVGIGLAAALLPLLQGIFNDYAGPFDLRWAELLGISAFGFVSALLAAYVPAWLASRQDPVAVLAGRRGDPRPRARSPLLGLALLGLGVAGAVMGARRGSGGENFIAVSAILTVLGMVLLIPVVLAVLGRLAKRWPLFLRYAVRDAARHRTRTVPAVAAVAATVAGVVALGIGQSSDEAQNRGTYAPRLAMGSAVLTGASTPRQWGELSDTVRRLLPEMRLARVRGIETSLPRGRYAYLAVSVSGEEPAGSYAEAYGSDVLVGSRLPTVGLGIPAGSRAAADRMLARGGIVVLSDDAVRGGRARLRLEIGEQNTGRTVRSAKATAPALVVRSTDPLPAARAVVAPSVARRLGAPVSTTALWLPGPVTSAAAQDLSEEANAAGAGLYVERGYRSNDESRLVQLVLGVLGAVLMLGGTLTATFLALSDARSDLATLSAVGASPRMRRRAAAAYAGVTGLVGALLGVLVGLVPGIAVTFPLTSRASAAPVPGAASHYLDIPWLLIGSLVVVLPLLTAVIVGVTSRARLPLAARVD